MPGLETNVPNHITQTPTSTLEVGVEHRGNVVGTNLCYRQCVSSGTIAGICVACAVTFVLFFVTVYHCYRRKRPSIPHGPVQKQPSSFYTRTKPITSPDLSSPETHPKASPLAPTKSFPQPRTPSPLQSDLKSPIKQYVSSPGSDNKLDPSTFNKDCYTEDGDEEMCKSGQDDSVDIINENCPLGEIEFSVEFKKDKNVFMVTIHKASSLPIKDLQTGTTDPYIKLCLLPEKKHKVKTRVLRKTLNPIYEETFTFYGLAYNQLQGVTLHFVTMSFDRFSRDDVIGEVIMPLANVDLSNKAVSLNKEIKARNPKVPKSQGRGELLVSLCYQPAANRLTVVVLKAKNLPKMDVTGLSDPYVKIFLMYSGQRLCKKKTRLKKRTLNPVFNESFLFDVPLEGLENVSIEFQVLDHDRVTKNEIIGRLVVGRQEGETADRHWSEIMHNPRKQIAEWHKLTD